MTRTVEAQLRISALDKTGQAFKSVAGKMADINRRAEALNRQQGVLARTSQAAYGTMLRYAAPAALAYGAKKALTDFAAIEREMTRIGITAGATAEETNSAFAQLQDISKQVAMPVEQAITALDTLTSSGMSMKEAMEFLPSVLKTAQASGAATEDIANTAIKSAGALKLQTGEMQRAFDIMVAGGKAGQFELKDMATYIPDLANSFASLGYTGEDGLKKLVAILQTIREDTGSASSAATFAQNIFGKIYSQDTANKFKNFGIDLRKELEQAKKNGEDTVAAFTRISKEAINGDLSKLPLLFTDEQFRLGMQSLMTSADSYKKFIETVNSSQVDGTVFRDLERVLNGTQASIDRLSGSWDKLMTSIGKGVSRPAVPVMDAVSNDLDYGEAVRAGLQKRGMGYWETETWMARNLPFGSFSKSAEADKLALENGYREPGFVRNMRQGPKNLYGPFRPAVPEQRSQIYGEYAASRIEGQRLEAERFRGAGALPSAFSSGPLANFFRVPSKEEFKDALKIDVSGLKETGDEAARKVADSGREAGASIKESAASLSVAGTDVGAAIDAAAARFVSAVKSMSNALAAGNGQRVNADTGRSMTPQVNGPRGGGGGGGY